MRFIFATWPEVEYQAKVLTKEGAKNRLVSYAFLAKLEDGFTDQYVETGVGPKRAKRRP